MDKKTIIQVDIKDIKNLEDEVSERAFEYLIKRIEPKIKSLFDEKITKAVEKIVSEKVEKIVLDSLDVEYTPLDRWGAPTEKITTLRKQVCSRFERETQYKKEHYSSDNNAFTKVADGIIKQYFTDFKEYFAKNIDEKYHNDCIEYAMQKFKERFGVK